MYDNEKYSYAVEKEIAMRCFKKNKPFQKRIKSRQVRTFREISSSFPMVRRMIKRENLRLVMRKGGNF